MDISTQLYTVNSSEHIIMLVCVCVCMCVCVHVCVCVCVCVCACAWVYCEQGSIRMSYVLMYICIYTVNEIFTISILFSFTRIRTQTRKENNSLRLSNNDLHTLLYRLNVKQSNPLYRKNITTVHKHVHTEIHTHEHQCRA